MNEHAKLTKDQVRRVVEALGETGRMLEKEMEHPAGLRNYDRIAFCEKHIAKLTAMLEA